METGDMIRKALEAKGNAYAPYSHYHVGCCVEMDDGSIFTGCNIENASYSATNCAERTAIFKGVSEGHHKLHKLALVGDSEFTYPCGICRQVIKEFSDSCVIIVAKDEENYRTYTLEELFPFGFGPEDLEKEG